MDVTSPAVTELPRPLEPVSRDTFLDDLAVAEDVLRPARRGRVPGPQPPPALAVLDLPRPEAYDPPVPG
jgi:hypothetical protein